MMIDSETHRTGYTPRDAFMAGGKGSWKRVLLREPEVCAECNKVYLSLYALKGCADHDGLERI